MVDPGEVVGALFQRAIGDAFGSRDVDPMIRRFSRASDDPADLQCDAGQRLARQVKASPREICERMVAALPANDVVERTVVTPNGFVNIWLRAAWLDAAAMRAASDPRLGIARITPERVVIDYSAPNVAKEMHVGHLRSTVIGDALARVLAFRGHEVIKQNHLGDWGTPIGMLYEHDGTADDALTIERAGVLYREANARFERDPAFAEAARARVMVLQAGLDAATRTWWERYVDLSKRYLEDVYRELGVSLAPGDVRGESFFNDKLGPLVDELLASGRAVMSDGAACLFVDGFVSKDGKPTPLILRKRDGGYGYAITDLAAIRFRLQALAASRLVYVVGAAQHRHLSMIFRAAEQLGWIVPPARVQHVGFGFVLDPATNAPIASREGSAPRLMDLVAAAIERADREVLVLEADKRRIASERGREPPTPMTDARRAETARVVGIASVKYADLSSDYRRDYYFDLDRMVKFRGDTAGSLQYAHARVRGLFREARGGDVGPIRIGTAAERALVHRLLDFGRVLAVVDERLEPHHLAGYLYDVTLAFTELYNTCPVLDAEPATRASRLAIAELTARTLAQGLDLLGIAAPERM